MQLSRKIPLLAVAAVLITGTATTAIAVVAGRDAIRASTFGATELGAISYGRAISVYVRHATSELATIAGLSEIARTWVDAGAEPAGANGEVAQRAVIRDDLTHSGAFESIALVHPDGRIHLMEPVEQQAELSRPDLGFMPWFREIVVTGAPVVSDLVVSTTTRRPTVVVAVPAVDAENVVAGYVVGSLDLAELSVVGGSPIGPYFGYLTDRRGLVIAHGRNPRYAAEQTDFSGVPAVVAALAGRSGVMESSNFPENEDRIAGYQQLPDLGWAVVYAIPTAIAYAPADDLVRGVSLTTLVLLVLVGLAAAVFARRTTGPLRRLADAATSISAGNADAPLPAAGTDEVGRLSGEFGRMVAVLGERETELRRRGGELEESNAGLTAANRELEAFSYSVSHDLRAPLRSIDAFSGILLAEHARSLDAEGQRVLGVIVRNSKRMGALIDDLLAFSRITRKELDRGPVDMHGLARSVAEELREAEPARSITFDIGPLCPVAGDAALLRQVWVNLLDNAVKFTRRVEQPSIAVTCERREGACRYSVRDNGVGFDPLYASKLFQPFQRLHKATEFEGTGIGLAIASRIVQRHGGSMWAVGAVGIGATFGFSIPGEKETP